MIKQLAPLLAVCIVHLSAQDSIFTGGDATMQRVRNAVVSIYSQGGAVTRGISAWKTSRGGSGTGFLISREGEIVTAYHVVDGASRVTVTTSDRREYSAEVIGFDPFIDVALLKVRSASTRFVDALLSNDVKAATREAMLKVSSVTGNFGFTNILTFGDSERLSPGKRVVALGNPVGLDMTFTSGIVSAVNRGGLGMWPIESFIQIDAAITHGNSGGPLMDVSGAVIGINDAGRTDAAGLNFAVPIHLAKRVIESIRNGKTIEHPYLGISVFQLDRKSKDRYNISSSVSSGVFVMGVAEGSGAQDAGVQFRDIITKVGAREIREPQDIYLALTNKSVGDEIAVSLIRGAESVNCRVTLRDRPYIPLYDPMSFCRVFLNFDLVRTNYDGCTRYAVGATYVPAESQSNWQLKTGDVIWAIEPWSPSGVPEELFDDEQLRYLLGEAVIDQESMIGMTVHQKANAKEGRWKRVFLSGNAMKMVY